ESESGGQGRPIVAALRDPAGRAYPDLRPDATSCFSSWSVAIAPGTRRPSSNTSAGVPLTLCFLPRSTLRASAAVSHWPMARAGIAPLIIQSRHALVLSLAHQMLRDFSGESPPRMGYRKV